MALPTAVVFPTPLPTATPIPSGFTGIEDARIVPIHGRYTKQYGVGIPLAPVCDRCETVILLAPKHIIDPTKDSWSGGSLPVEDAGVHLVSSHGEGVRLFWFAGLGDESLDIAIGGIGLAVDSIPDFRFEIAPPGTVINVGDEVRIVTADFLENDERKIVAQHRVLDGVVSIFTCKQRGTGKGVED